MCLCECVTGVILIGDLDYDGRLKFLQFDSWNESVNAGNICIKD